MARIAQALHCGTLDKEKERSRVVSGLSLGFSRHFFVCEPGLLSWWDEERAAGQAPAKGTIVLDQYTIMSNLKHSRSGHKFAFRIDRHALKSSHKEKLVLAAQTAEAAGEWRRALRKAGAADDLRDDSYTPLDKTSSRGDSNEPDEQSEVMNPVLAFLHTGKVPSRISSESYTGSELGCESWPAPPASTATTHPAFWCLSCWH